MKASTMHANLRAQARLVTWSAPKLEHSGSVLAAILHQKVLTNIQMPSVTLQSSFSTLGGSR